MKSVQSQRVTIEIGQDRLIEELGRLQQKLGLGYELGVVWLPDSHNKLSGEVKGDQIRIYAEDEQNALETLKHEFLDYLISKAIEPYQKIANKLIGLMNDEAYSRKEKLVEVLSGLI
ncbi:hypothetical protein MUO79_02805 [Candidatus Bathyarchaeota archaeon]|jgi:hypothetical protein|nr:hypothetical protein [Candidatus Bathyarchaeota archaeon]